jgi:hypothetical protein
LNSGVYVHPHIQQVLDLHHDLLREAFLVRPVIETLAAMAQRLHQAHSEGDSRTVVQIRNWLPGAARQDDEQILGRPLSVDDARLAIAREYGWESWQELARAALDPPDRTFERAVQATVHGELLELHSLLREEPSLVRARSPFGHRATLIHYLGANGVEFHHQMTPRNAPEVARALIGAGVDVNATARFYGKDTTVLPLIMTSAHPRAAGVADQLIAVLKAAGASPGP